MEQRSNWSLPDSSTGGGSHQEDVTLSPIVYVTVHVQTHTHTRMHATREKWAYTKVQ